MFHVASEYEFQYAYTMISFRLLPVNLVNKNEFNVLVKKNLFDLCDNLDFLREICGEGYSAVTFLKMLPYFETPIEKQLRGERRLKGKPGFLDYDLNSKISFLLRL